MQDTLTNPPKLFARTPHGRMVQIAGHPGDVGRLDNIVVPTKQEIRRLRPVVSFIEKLKPQPFNDGTTSRYRKHLEQSQPPVFPIPYNRFDNLPLFRKP